MNINERKPSSLMNDVFIYTPAYSIDCEEIRIVLFSIGDDKATGPNEFSSCFLKKAGSIVKEDFVAAVMCFFFFYTLLLYQVLNSTVLALVPKGSNSSMGNFRPISCCSVVYKTITKILYNKIQKILPKLVSWN